MKDERVLKCGFILLYAFISYIEAQNKSGLDSLDYRDDLATQNLFR